MAQTYTCGMAVGFPPYQYQNQKNEPAGIDYEVAKLVFKTSKLNVKFVQKEWTELLSELFHNSGKIDALCGSEITPERSKYVDFTVPFYHRKAALFFLKEKKYKSISDLTNQIVTGDRHSSFEKYLGDLRSKIRIVETKSKEESFKKLGSREVDGAIAPIEVGLHLAKKFKLKVSYFEEKDEGSSVAFAVSKGNTNLLNKLNKSLKKLLHNGQIKTIIKKKYQ